MAKNRRFMNFFTEYDILRFFPLGNFLGNLCYAFELKCRKIVDETVVQGLLKNLYHRLKSFIDGRVDCFDNRRDAERVPYLLQFCC